MKVNDQAAASATTRRTQAERTAATRALLIDAGRKLFADKGFNDISTQAIVAAAGVTRGALYHQFDDKVGLFAEVYEQVERQLVEDIARQIMELQPLDPLEAMRVGARLFLDGCSAPDVQQIVLIDAPAVLGWDRWRAVGVKYGLGVIEAMLAHAIAEGAVPEQPLRPTAHVLLGALDEAALYVSRAADREQARRRDGRRVRAADQRDRRARIACLHGRYWIRTPQSRRLMWAALVLSLVLGVALVVVDRQEADAAGQVAVPLTDEQAVEQVVGSARTDRRCGAVAGCRRRLHICIVRERERDLPIRRLSI